MLKPLIKQRVAVSMLLGVWDLVITIWMRPLSRSENLNKVLNKVNKVKSKLISTICDTIDTIIFALSTTMNDKNITRKPIYFLTAGYFHNAKSERLLYFVTIISMHLFCAGFLVKSIPKTFPEYLCH